MITDRFGCYREISGRGLVTANQSLVTDTVEKGQNEPIKIFACAPVETGFS
jgi:hypothetical protein